MTDTDWVLARMMKHFLESMMTGELEHHIAEKVNLPLSPTVRTAEVRRRYAV
jgi:hypothetical protein